MLKKMNIKDIFKHYSNFNKLHSALRSKRKALNKTLKHKIYRNILKRRQNQVNNELKKLKLYKLANIDYTSEKDSVNIRKFKTYSVKTLHQIAKLRNINTNMSKKGTIYALIRSEPVINEEKYLIHLNNDSNKDIVNRINKLACNFLKCHLI